MTCVTKVSSTPSRYKPRRLYCPSRQGKHLYSCCGTMALSKSRGLYPRLYGSLYQRLVQNCYCRPPALWMSPKAVLLFEFVQVPGLVQVAPVHFVVSLDCVAEISLLCFFLPCSSPFYCLAQNFPASLHRWVHVFLCSGLSIALKLLSLSEESVLSHLNTHHSC